MRVSLSWGHFRVLRNPENTGVIQYDFLKPLHSVIQETVADKIFALSEANILVRQ